MRALRIAMVVLPLVAYGQTSRGTVTGTVLDPSGSVMRRAQVHLSAVETGVKLAAESNDSGVYRFDAVDLGVYEIEVAPGATEAAGSTVSSGVANTGGFSINGQRPRGNNYMLDGTDNNEVWVTGQEQVFTIADAVEEVSVQTSNFGVEFGRAGGGVFNVITKSGTNDLHGTLLWRYQSQRFNSISNLDKLNGVKQGVFSDNVYGFTVGGPRTDQELPIQLPWVRACG